MKLNLECGNLLRSGYVNANSHSVPLNENVTEDMPFILGHFKNLKSIFPNEKFEEIIFNLPLNILTPEDLLPVISHWKEMLDANGILKVFFIDIRRVARATQVESINIQDTHNLIYGENYAYKSIMDASIFKNVCKSMGFQIEMMSIKDYFAAFELKNA